MRSNSLTYDVITNLLLLTTFSYIIAHNCEVGIFSSLFHLHRFILSAFCGIILFLMCGDALLWLGLAKILIHFLLAILRFAKSHSSGLRIWKSTKRRIHKNTKVSPCFLVHFLAYVPLAKSSIFSLIATLRSRQNTARATRANHHPLTPPQNPYSSRSPSVVSDGSYSTSGPLSPPHSMTSDGGEFKRRFYFSTMIQRLPEP